MSTFADKLAAGLADALTLRDPDLSWQPVPLPPHPALRAFAADYAIEHYLPAPTRTENQ